MERLSPEEYRRMVGLPCTATLKNKPVQYQQSATFVLKGSIPPSTNALFATVKDKDTGKTRRVKCAKYLGYAKEVRGKLFALLDPKLTYHFHVRLYTNCLNKDGSLKKQDASNRIKAIEDICARALGLDDRQFVRVSAEWIHTKKTSGTVIEIVPWELKEGDL